MDQGPLPPHERPWRHPSELAAEERAAVAAQPAPMRARRMVWCSGAVGMIVVGVLLLSLAPTAIVTSSSASTTMPVGPNRMSAAIGIASQVTIATTPPVLVTPIDDGLHGVATLEAIETAISDTDGIRVTLSDGTSARARLVVTGDDAAVLRLDRVAPALPVSMRQPAVSDIVTVLAQPPVTIAYGELASTQLGGTIDGVAVIDARGYLIGLCEESDDGTKLVLITDEYEVATSGAP